MCDFDDSDPTDHFEPYYALPEDDWRDKQNRLEGGGNIFKTYDLSKLLTQEDLDHFYKWVK
jgi:hypothetical protein